MATRALPLRRPTLRPEEAAGLGVALAAHVALGFWLAHQPPAEPLPLPERMTVTFSDQVAEQSTAPKPAAEAPPAVAPVIADKPAPEPAPEPRPVQQPAPPQPRAAAPRPEPAKPQPTRPQPQAVKPAPAARVQPAPRALPVPAPVRPSPAKQAAPAKPAPAKQAAPAKPAPAKPAPPAKAGGGGSRLGADFLKGLPNGQAPAARQPAPAAEAIGPAVKTALSGAIARQLKPKWAAPQGAEADQLVTVLSWDLNADGTLAGPPRLVSQTGVTDANRPQAQRHVEQAMRAVRLAAPFDLPPDLYPAWKRVGQFRFDRKLSQ